MIPIVIGSVLFLAGLVIAAQGVIGKEITSEVWVFGVKEDPGSPRVKHPPDRTGAGSCWPASG